jgi:hypothetical protein
MRRGCRAPLARLASHACKQRTGRQDRLSNAFTKPAGAQDVEIRRYAQTPDLTTSRQDSVKRSRARGRTVSDVPQQVADAVERVEREREGGGELERRLEPGRELCKGRRRRQRERNEVSNGGGKGARRLSGEGGCLEGEEQSLARRETALPVSLTSGPPSPASSSGAPDAAQPDAPESLPARVRRKPP